MEDWFFNLGKVNGLWDLSLPGSVVHSPAYPLETPGERFTNVSAYGAPPGEMLIEMGWAGPGNP